MEFEINKRTKLIRWQRITIAILLTVVSVLSFCYQREHQKANLATERLQGLIRTNLMEASYREIEDAQHEANFQYYNRTLQNLEITIRHYEDKYSKNDPLQKGCGRGAESVSTGPLGPGVAKRYIAQSMSLDSKKTGNPKVD